MLFDRDKSENTQSPPSLPFIFQKNQYHHQKSNKSLYKNDSQSSHLTINPQNYQLNYDKSNRQTLNIKNSFISNDLQNSASIKKYLKKGQEFNKFNAQKISKLQNGLDQNILRNYINKIPKDYSINRFPIQSQLQQKSNQKSQSLKKIYLSMNKKNKSNGSRFDKFSNKNNKRFSTLSKLSQPKHLKKLVNQEVQTQKTILKQKKLKPAQKIPIKGTPKINSLQVIEKSNIKNKMDQKTNVSVSKFINLSSILQKDQQQHQPPKKLSSIRLNHYQTKYLINQSFSGQQSTAPSMFTNTYLDSMSKLSSNFNSDVQKIKKNRYQFSDRSDNSPQRYSRTIEAVDTKNIDIQTINPDQGEKQPRNLLINNKNQTSSQKNKSSIINQHCKKDISTQVEDNNKQQKLKTNKQNLTQDDQKQMSLSIVAQQSKNINSLQDQSLFQPFSALPIVNEQKEYTHHEKFDNQNISRKQINSSKASQIDENIIKTNFKHKNTKKIDEMMQFPQVSQLRISPMQNNQQNTQKRMIHPIRNNFNQKGINWITDAYHPKSKIFDFINLHNFVIKKYRNGVYFGELVDNKKQGSGIIFYFNGKLYEGKFFNDLKTGEGYEEFPDGSKYQGQFKNGTKCGKGVFQWANGEIYQGQWQSGKKHGSGIWKSSDGQSYIGEWKYGKAEGFGVFISKLGDRYEGQFQNSQKQGFGTQRYSNGQTYVGEYRKNRPNGQGQYFWTNGNYYKGQFVNHLRHGEGYFKDIKNNQEYKGQYRNDKKCGFGQLRGNTTTYVGNFQNDYKHGYGELYENQQCKYKGYWVNGNYLDDEQVHQQGCPLNKNQIQVIEQKPELTNSKNRFKPSRLKTINQSKNNQNNNRNNNIINHGNNNFQPQFQGRSSLSKSLSPQNKSIQSLQNNSLQKSNYKRSCGCTRRH